MASPRQLDLLNDWTPPETTAAFDPALIRASTIAGMISRAVAAALRDCPLKRAEVAERMTAYLGEAVTTNMVNAYASQAREEHVIPVNRLLALIHVTNDRRLLQALADQFGWAVIEKRHLPMIEAAAIDAHIRELDKRRDALRRQARGNT